MADLPEKDNLETTEEFSTIFSDPAEHRKIKIKNKKLWPKVLAGALSLAVLIGSTVAVIKLIPEKEDENNISSQDNTIQVMKLDAAEVTSVVVNNSKGSTEIYCETADETVNWYTKQVDKALTKSAKIEEIVTAVTDISATMKITQKTAEECGLTSPAVKAVVQPEKGEAYTVLVGAESPDKSGYYLKLENQDTIYLVSSSVYTSLEFDLLDLADDSKIPGFVNDGSVAEDYFSSDTITKFDRVVIDSKKYDKPIEISFNTNGEISEFHQYLITSPQKRLANTESIEEIMSFYQNGVTVSGAYSYEVSAATLKQFGLSDPDISLTMYAGSKSITYVFALQEDGDYAAVGSDSRLIHRVISDTVRDLVGFTTEDYYNTTIFMTNINKISNFTLSKGEEKYSFDIVKNESEDGEETYTITTGGKELVADNFQTFYNKCVDLVIEDFTVDNSTAAADVSILITLNDGDTLTIDFTKVSETRYQCKMDGNSMGRVTATNVNYLLETVKKVAEGKTIS